jgi:hypothetical protein
VSGAWRGFVFDLGACKCSVLNSPVGGTGAEATSPRGPRARQKLTRGGDRLSSEAEPRSRGGPAPERGGNSLEGATASRARRNLARGGAQPPSGAEPHPSGATGPRARRNLVRGGAQPPSEVEVCPCSVVPLERSGVLLEGGWVICLVGLQGHQSRWPAVGQ